MFSGILGLSALLLLLSVVSLDCCSCCCSSGCALPELSGSAVHAATKLLTSCTVTAPDSHEVLSNASLLLALLLVFWCFHLLLASSVPSCLLRFGGVDDRGVDPLGTLAVFAIVEMILLDDIVVLCFCCVVCFLCGCRGAFGFRGKIVVRWNSAWHVINVVA